MKKPKGSSGERPEDFGVRVVEAHLAGVDAGLREAAGLLEQVVLAGRACPRTRAALEQLRAARETLAAVAPAVRHQAAKCAGIRARLEAKRRRANRAADRSDLPFPDGWDRLGG